MEPRTTPARSHGAPGPAAGSDGVVDEGLEHRFLGDEAGQRRDAGHRGGADRRHDRQGPGRAVDAGELADVTGPGLVVDDAHHQEERGLEQPVRQEQGESGECRVGGAEAHHHGQEAQLAHGAVGQDELDVRLPQRPVAAHQHGGQAQAEHDRQPVRGVRESGGQPGHKVDPGLHHGRGVQVGAHGRGGGHGAGEPEVERHQRGFGDRTDQDEDDGGAHGPAGGAGDQGGRLVQDGLESGRFRR